MKKLDAFKRLIREEVRQVIREELKNLISELKAPASPAPATYRKSLKESIGTVPQKRAMPIVRETGDPIKDLLAETATSMTGDEYRTMVNLGSNEAQGFPQMYATPEPQVVESVTDMFASTRPVSDINQVEINAVPDFSALMKTMQAKGQI